MRKEVIHFLKSLHEFALIDLGTKRSRMFYVCVCVCVVARKILSILNLQNYIYDHSKGFLIGNIGSISEIKHMI